MLADIDRISNALGSSWAGSSDFDLNPGLMQTPGGALRKAAVLIGLWERPSGLCLILTKRASHLLHHPGQIAFPGGKVDEGDCDVTETALREAREEVGLSETMVRVLGLLPQHETVTGFAVTPVVGHIRGDFLPRPEAGEVDEVFLVPINHVLNTANYRIERRLWRGEWRRYYAVPYGPYYIWGATARILRGMAERLAQ